MASVALYRSARARLAGATDDQKALAAFDRVVAAAGAGRPAQENAALDAFISEAGRLGLSLDYIFIGSGKPYVRCEAAFWTTSTSQNAGTNAGRQSGLTAS